MTTGEATALLEQVAPTGWLVLSSPLLLTAALERIHAGELQCQLVLLLDDEGYRPPADPPVPVYVITYDVRPAAFLCGVAAAESSNNGMFTVLASSADPQAQAFIDAVWTGCKYHTNGAMVATSIIPVDDFTGIVSPTVFQVLHTKLKERMGPYFLCNHFIAALGRATPSILYALTDNPTNAFVVGGYADFRMVRERG